MILPNFLILGAQKSATTWLWQMLKQHPEIYLPERKELGYFCYYPMHRRRRGGWKDSKFTKTLLEDYSELYFSDVSNEKAVGEATPVYLWVSDERPEWLQRDPALRYDTPAVVRRLLGEEMKFLVILRNPVARAISAFHHFQKHGEIEVEAKIMEHAGRFGIVHIGFYYLHLKKWLETFDRECFKIMIMEEDLCNPTETLAEIFNFLNVGNTSALSGVEKRIHEGIAGAEVTQEDRAELGRIFAEDIQALEKMLERDLSCWRAIS